MALVERWLREAGLETRRDAVGNLFGRLAGTSERVVLTGSHVDTVKQGGKYDGALGVHASLAAVAALAVRSSAKKTLETVVICEEEGSRFPTNFWGARGDLRRIKPEEAERVRDADGISLGRGDAGRAGSTRPGSRRPSDGTSTPSSSCTSSRGGCSSRRATRSGGDHDHRPAPPPRHGKGRQDHAGATPMDLRVDPMAGAAEMIHRLTTSRPASAARQC